MRISKGQEVACDVDLSRRDFEPLPDPDLPISIVHEDEHLVIVEKPAGIACHPLAEDQNGTLANWIVAHYPEAVAAGVNPREAGLLHRLDVTTSGLIMFARSKPAHQAIWDLGRAGGVLKSYIVLAMGKWRGDDRINWPIAAHPIDRSRVVAIRGPGVKYRGRALEAESRLFLKRQLGRFFLAEMSLYMGRRHQVRVHLAACGHPLVGDKLYGGPDAFSLGRPFIHACGLNFVHPLTDEDIDFYSAIPVELEKALQTAAAIREQPSTPRPLDSAEWRDDNHRGGYHQGSRSMRSEGYSGRSSVGQRSGGGQRSSGGQRSGGGRQSRGEGPNRGNGDSGWRERRGGSQTSEQPSRGSGNPDAGSRDSSGNRLGGPRSASQDPGRDGTGREKPNRSGENHDSGTRRDSGNRPEPGNRGGSGNREGGNRSDDQTDKGNDARPTRRRTSRGGSR